MDAFYSFTAAIGLKVNMVKSQIVFGGDCRRQKECEDATGFTIGQLPLKHLGMPITASKLSKLECNALVNKIMARITHWSFRHILYAGRVTLINSVLFGVFSYWVHTFILPQAVITLITRLYRNFLWGGQSEYKKVPYIS